MPILNFSFIGGLAQVPAGHLKAALSSCMESGASINADAVIALIDRADLTDADVGQLIWIADMGQVHFMALGFDDVAAMADCDEYRKVSEHLEGRASGMGVGSR